MIYAKTFFWNTQTHTHVQYNRSGNILSLLLPLFQNIQVNGKRGPGRPKMTWKQLTERDRREWKLSAIDPHDRDTWRSGVRSAMRAASQLPGRGPTVVDMAPVPARLSNIR